MYRFALGILFFFALTLMNCENTTDCPSSECAADTSGLVVIITPPTGIAGEVTVTGPNGYSQILASSDTLPGLAIGSYTFAAKRVKTSGTIVGKAYYGKLSKSAVTLASCERQTVTVTYTQEPGSEKLWVAADSKLQAFAATNLAASGSPAPAVSLKAPPSPGAITFDAKGNLWFTNAEGVYMYAMEDLGTSTADYKVKLSGSGVMGNGIPGASALAFDDDGSLWVGQKADQKLVKFTSAQIASTGTPTPSVSITTANIGGVESMALDADGNLFVAGDDVLRFNKARLASSFSGAADAKIVRKSGPPVIGVYTAPNALAFAGNGTLWTAFFNGGNLIPLDKGLQAASDTLTPGIVLNASVLSLVEGLAIDEAGALWMPGSQGKILSIAASTLGTSGDISAAVILSSASVTYAGSLAFNPAPESLPLRD